MKAFSKFTTIFKTKIYFCLYLLVIAVIAMIVSEYKGVQSNHFAYLTFYFDNN